MAFPIIPQQQNNYHPGMHRYPNNRFPSHINQPANKNSIQQMIKSFSNPASPIGTLATKGLGNISKTLSNVDQVIKVVQSATPIVQEYGPMVKNLPAMYRMVKALGQIEDDNTDRKIEKVSDQQVFKEDKVEQERDRFTGKSTPRMYI